MTANDVDTVRTEPQPGCPLCDELHKRGSEECPGRWVGQVVAGKYRIERVIGAGGIGAVYGAKHIALNRLVALKMLQPQYVKDRELGQRFVREARQQAGLGHPGIVQVHDAGVDAEGRCYLEMEELDGATLYDLIHQSEPLAIARVVAIAIELLDVLQVIHGEGIVHRDLKSPNVFIARTKEGERVKILDFGLAKVDDGHALTHTGQELGTLLYMSPEQLTDPRNVDARTDIFSVAIILFEALTGRWPVVYKKKSELRKKILQGELELHAMGFRAEVPEWLDAIVARAMAQERDARFPSAREMKQALERGLAQERTLWARFRRLLKRK